ncbi:MAG TPA: S9 family peptidase [Steroidobacter sp.]|uniref:S9 family peptidase n=1 Tax=Steroidobacter sp. TaxID=1978227 RepID=UPI002ED993EB
MKRTVLSGVVALVATTAFIASHDVACAEERSAFTVEDLLRLRRLSDLQVSPDGRYAAFTVSETDIETNRSGTSLWLLDPQAPTGSPRQVSVSDHDEWNARWMPDSRGLYFLSDRSGSVQVWRSKLDGAEATQITRLPLDVQALKVAPRGDRLLIALEVFPDCADLDCSARRMQRTPEPRGTGRVYERLFVRHWDRWKDGRQSHLYSLRLTSAGTAEAPVDLTRALDADVPSKPRGGDEEFNFSPDGSRVAFTARIKGKTEAWSTNFDVYEVAADGSSEPRNLTSNNPAWDSAPTYSPDGRVLAWKAMRRPQNEADRFQLVFKDVRSGNVRTLAADWDRSVDRFAFSPDGRHILATTDHLGQHVLWKIDARSGAVKLLETEGQVTEFGVARQNIVYARSALDSPADLYLLNRDGTSERLTTLNASRLEQLRISPFEQFTFLGWNAERVHGYVMQPYGFEKGRKYPVLLIVHGGPQLSFGNGWSYRWNPQVYAGAGYAVVFIDYHGSTGYGQAFTDSITGDWGGKPLEDLRIGLAAAMATYPWLDRESVCALGASYGGYMMNWIESQWSDRFRCLVNYAGVFDVRGMYYQTDEMWLDEFELGGPEFGVPASYEKHNPLRHVSSWNTPMLVGHGQQDFNVPYEQGISTFTALQRRGIESRLVIFPDETHFILQARNQLQWQHEVLAWLDRWLRTR